MPNEILSTIITKGQMNTRYRTDFRPAASWASLNKSLLKTVRYELDALPPIGHILFDANIVFADPGKYALTGRVEELPPLHRKLALDRLIDKLSSKIPGDAQVQRFAAIREASTILEPSDQIAILIRLADTLRWLPERDTTSNRINEFRALLALKEGLTLEEGSGHDSAFKLLLTLVDQIEFLPTADQNNRNARLQILLQMIFYPLGHSQQRKAIFLSQLVPQIATFTYHHGREDLLNRLQRVLEADIRPEFKHHVLTQIARHGSHLQVDKLELTRWIGEQCSALNDSDHLAVFKQHIEAIGSGSNYYNEELLTALNAHINTVSILKPSLGSALRASMSIHEENEIPATVESSLAKARVFSLAENTMTLRSSIAGLSEHDKLSALLGATDDIDSTMPTAGRFEKFRGVINAANHENLAIFTEVYSKLLTKFHLVPAIEASICIQIRKDLADQFPSKAAEFVGTIAKNLDRLESMPAFFNIQSKNTQAMVGEVLLASASRIDPEINPIANAKALLNLGKNTWRLKNDVDRHNLTKLIHEKILDMSLEARNAIFPEWVSSLSFHTVGDAMPGFHGELVEQMLENTESETSIKVLCKLAETLGCLDEDDAAKTIKKIRNGVSDLPPSKKLPIFSILERHETVLGD